MVDIVFQYQLSERIDKLHACIYAMIQALMHTNKFCMYSLKKILKSN